jgi:hypothetical protein
MLFYGAEFRKNSLDRKIEEISAEASKFRLPDIHEIISSGIEKKCSLVQCPAKKFKRKKAEVHRMA